MPKTYTITAENARVIREAMDKKENQRFYKRLLAVALRGEGKSNGEIAEITGFNGKYVSQLVSLYCRLGLSNLASDGRKGGNHRNMSDDEEREFLESFRKKAEKGQIITVKEMTAAYYKKLGKSCNKEIYYLLHKHGWRKIMPRGKHPKRATAEEIESSKKLTNNSKNCALSTVSTRGEFA